MSVLCRCVRFSDYLGFLLFSPANLFLSLCEDAVSVALWLICQNERALFLSDVIFLEHLMRDTDIAFSLTQFTIMLNG